VSCILILVAAVLADPWPHLGRTYELTGPRSQDMHGVTMGEQHRAGRYDRLADGVEQVTGRSAMSVREFVALYADELGGRRS
jgi:hypothetical protein